MKIKYLVLFFIVGSANADPFLQLQQNAYGPGVHMDQYGRAIHSQPELQLRPNTYGPGMYSDQYGRPSTVQPSTDERPWELYLKEMNGY